LARPRLPIAMRLPTATALALIDFIQLLLGFVQGFRRASHWAGRRPT
jgi:hypothetical protein